MTSIAVVVPTYGRPASLAACLAALGDQLHPADEVIVVARSGDEESARVAASAPIACRYLEIHEPGVLAAMAAGARAATSEVIAFTDDDAVAPSGWVRDLVSMLTEDAAGAVGGRDELFDGEVARVEPRASDVGHLTWYGRHVGNHHLGAGLPREVAFLKGVNAAYRRRALGIPRGLRGSGAQAHYEIAVGRFVRARGYVLVYDPALTVQHRPAVRLGDDLRAVPTQLAVSDAAYNLVVAIGGARGLVHAVYAVVLGDRGCPGLVRGLVAVARSDAATWHKVTPSLRGTIAGAVSVLGHRGVTYETFD